MSRRLLVLVIAGVVVAALAVSRVSAVSGGASDSAPDVKVARLVDGRCGKFADSLPALVSRTGATPGAVVGDVTVCIKNVGEAGTLSARVLELVGVDPACTGDEASNDVTCGGDAGGELAPSLVQRTGVGTCSSDAIATSASMDRRLPSLQESPLVLTARLRRDQLVCVRLLLRYEPATPAATVASQSDRATWRYEFNLVAR